MKNNLVICVLLYLAVFLSSNVHAYRDCYHCGYPSDFMAGKNCKEPDLSKIHRIRIYDHEEECMACYKSIDETNDIVDRGCVDSDTWNATQQIFGFDSLSGCKSHGNITAYCICTRNMCNSSSSHNLSVLLQIFMLFNMIAFIQMLLK